VTRRIRKVRVSIGPRYCWCCPGRVRSTTEFPLVCRMCCAGNRMLLRSRDQGDNTPHICASDPALGRAQWPAQPGRRGRDAHGCRSARVDGRVLRGDKEARYKPISFGAGARKPLHDRPRDRSATRMTVCLPQGADAKRFRARRARFFAPIESMLPGQWANHSGPLECIVLFEFMTAGGPPAIAARRPEKEDLSTAKTRPADGSTCLA